MTPYQTIYFQNQVATASREQILIMLHDGALRFLRQAKEARKNGNRVAKLENVGKVVGILTELSNTLDHEKGGEIVENLDSLYWYMIRELTRSNAQDDPEPMNVVDIILTDLRDGWIQAVDKVKSAQKSESETGRHAHAHAGPMQAAV